MTTITTSQAATKLGVSIRTIQRRCAAGRLPAVKQRRRWIITVEDTVTDLPTLTGRPDDIRLADGDRRTMLDRLAEQLTATAGNAPAGLLGEMIALYREVALRHTDARWWLVNNSRPLGPILQREMTGADKARLAEIAARR